MNHLIVFSHRVNVNTFLCVFLSSFLNNYIFLNNHIYTYIYIYEPQQTIYEVALELIDPIMDCCEILLSYYQESK